MNKKQKDLMSKIKRIQKRNQRRRMVFIIFGQLLSVCITGALAWLVWENIVTKAILAPHLTFLENIVYTLLNYSIILLTAQLARKIQRKEGK